MPRNSVDSYFGIPGFDRSIVERVGERFGLLRLLRLRGGLRLRGVLRLSVRFERGSFLRQSRQDNVVVGVEERGLTS